jgi:hypothetical protein
MQSDRKDNSVSAEALRRKHESENPDTGWLLFGAALIVLMVIGSFLIIRLMVGMLREGRSPDETEQRRGSIVAPNEEMLQRFPRPNLQINPRDELLALDARDDAVLHSYEWVDREAGVVRIPIGRAMELLAERGLPTRASNAPARTGPSKLELIRQRSEEK